MTQMGLIRIVLFLAGILFPSVLAAKTAEDGSAILRSPDGALMLRVEITDGRAYWSLDRLGQPVIARSRLGLVFTRGPSLAEQLRLLGTERARADETWTLPCGEKATIRDRNEELRLLLAGENGARMTLVFRLFDDGLGLRYEVDGRQGERRDIADELTEFAMTGDHESWWTPAYMPDRYEYPTSHTRLSAIQKANTPFTMRTAAGLHLAIHEAALVDYGAMALERIRPTVLKADITPWQNGPKVKTEGAFRTPWRTVQIADQAVGLINSDIILNLNEPNRLGDVSWIEPGKYVGIWWEMHIGKSTWGSGPRHGATTANAKRYIDFAAKYGFKGVLVEGWNIGWDGNWIANSDQFRFTTPYPDYDFDALAAYAKERGVRLIGHHETSGGIDNYEAQLEDAMRYMAEHEVRNIKTGYVKLNGQILRKSGEDAPQLEWQHGQYMVRHYQKVIETAAKYRIGINTHEPIKDTGLRRTFPNWLTREGARGMEYDAWSAGNAPDHTILLAFTRLLGGPMDFTPGIFDLMPYGKDSPHRVRTTLAKQLALYVTILSPLQMAADLPENYEANPGPFRFIRDVPADWSDSRALLGEIGDYLVMARKDRASEDWYLGAITDENGRVLEVPLSFLEPGRRYEAQIYRDGAGAHWESNPYPVEILSETVTADGSLRLALAPGGGTAIRFMAEKTP
ncbi:MAG: glycoside hydrolase family 97 protein [Rhodothalassiaceae bacterium]